MLKAEVGDDMADTLYGDPDRLKQIVMNLIDNAIKFTDQGTVTARIYRTDTEHWAIQVTDTGRGIPADVQSDIFEAFWQVDSSITREINRGVGLGLSIVKQLVILMQGSIVLQSEPGHGSTFTITLPLNEKQGELV
jgi:two-component system capsular synthesis sensor histidine kinase RcsC